MKYFKFLYIVLISATFLSNISRADNKWSFIVMSDIHIYPSGKIPPAFLKMVEAIKKRNPKFIILNGDQTSGNRGDGASAEKVKYWYQQLDKSLTPLYDKNIPIIPVIGNHDFYEESHREGHRKWATKILSQYNLDYINKENFPYYFGFAHEGVEFIVMNLWRQKIDSTQKAWFEKNFSYIPQKERFTFGHVPAKSAVGTTSPSYMNEVGTMFSENHVDIYFAGHEHMYWDEYLTFLPQTVRQITVGTASGTYNFPVKKSNRKEYCNEELTRCRMPSNEGEFAIETRKVKVRINGEWVYRVYDGYEVHSQNFIEVIFEGGEYSINSYSINDQMQVVPFYLE